MLSIFDFSPDNFNNLQNRRIRALLPQEQEQETSHPHVTLRSSLAQPARAFSSAFVSSKGVSDEGSLDVPFDKETLDDIWRNVQGDVFQEMPKEAENFIFFRIRDVARFKNDLRSYSPTSSIEVLDALRKINRAKGRQERASISLSQISFSRAGLDLLGRTEMIRDPRFDTRPMKQDKDELGDLSTYTPLFAEGVLHGVFLVTGSDVDKCEKRSDYIRTQFSESIISTDNMILKGHVRPGKLRGHEHFGYKDGVSQPALRGLLKPHNGQLECDAGVIIMGHAGDPIYDNPSAPQRPSWTKNGSILVVRKLEQDVVEFDNYLAIRGRDWKRYATGDVLNQPIDSINGAELLGAQMIGRWKSGAPLDTNPFRDNPSQRKNEDTLNAFDYTRPDESVPTNRYCPFTAHTRKTAPRNLDPYIAKKFLESGLIIRTGIPYGPEVTAEERNAGKSKKLDPITGIRGLIFTCYQSSLDNGFVRQTKDFANNDYFPVASFVPTKHGQDPILGAPEKPSSATVNQDDGVVDIPNRPGRVDLRIRNKQGEYIDVSGFASPADLSQSSDSTYIKQEFFVTSRGGEYFFVPSVSFVKELSGESSGTETNKLDIVFLQDATGSMNPYIRTVREKIGIILDKISKSPKLLQETLHVRFGLIAFRDYPPQDETMLTSDYGFTSDPGVIKDWLSNLKSIGGKDGPEAQTAALAAALSTKWEPSSMKMVILVTDSPPHAIGELDDVFARGTPDNEDPIKLTDQMKERKIPLYVVACEPTLSWTYAYAHDFYCGIAEKTHGKMFPLLESEKLADCIIGCALQHADLESLIAQHSPSVRDQFNHSQNFDRVVSNFHSKLQYSNVKVNKLDVENIYVESERGRRNREAWKNAKDLAEGRANVRMVEGTRIQSQFQRGRSCKVELTQDKPDLNLARRIVKRALDQ